MGVPVQGFLLRRQVELSGKLAKIISEDFFSFEEIKHKILSERNFNKIIPEVEVHIDHFLSVKLKEKMPMVGMFVGERTLAQLKEIFMEELETLFPVIMETYLVGLEQDFDIKQFVVNKLAAIPDTKISAYINEILSKQLAFLQFTGALIGFFLGSIQILIMLFLTR